MSNTVDIDTELPSNFVLRTLLNLANRNGPGETFPVTRLFMNRYKQRPCVRKCGSPEPTAYFHVSSVLKYFQADFAHNAENDVIQRRFHTTTNQLYVSGRVSDLGNGIMIFIRRTFAKMDVDNPYGYTSDFSNDSFLVTSLISFYYLRKCDSLVTDIVENCIKLLVFDTKWTKINFVRRKNATFGLMPIRIKMPIIYNLGLHYGEKFIDVHKKIITKLNEKDGNGIVLLHGSPGSGKTHYIRYLIQEIKNKKIIYITPDMAQDITKPDFTNFLIHHSNSILIFEDAETIVRDRNEPTFNGTQAVANLLNLSDGLLNDALHMQIIATFNCNLTSIDRALLRPGRLIANYEFGKLDVENAKILSTKLGFNHSEIANPMVLAEIYNQHKNNDNAIIV